MPKLSDSEIQEALASQIPQWTRNGDHLERSWEFPSFKLAMDFVSKVACVAEEVNHHPDITINYTRVRMELTSHDSGGVTRRDLRLAAKIDQIAPELMNPGQLRTA